MKINLDNIPQNAVIAKPESEDISGAKTAAELLDSVDKEDSVEDSIDIEEFEDVDPDDDLENAEDAEDDDLSLGIAAEFAAFVAVQEEEDEIKDSDVFDDEPVPAEELNDRPERFEDAVPDLRIIKDEPVPEEDFVPEVIRGGKTTPATKVKKRYRYPAVAAVAAVALLATPVLSIAAIDAMDGDFSFGRIMPTNNGNQNVDPNGNGNTSGNVNANANANGNANTNANTNTGPEVIYPESKVLHFALEGPGHIEPVSNCEIDGVTGTITFIDTHENASFRIVKDVEGASVEIHCGETVIDGDIVVLQPLSDYPEISFKFVDEVAVAAALEQAERERIAAEQAAAEEAARQAAAEQEAATRAAQQQSQAYQAAPSQSTYVAPTPEPAPAPAPTPAPEPVYVPPAPEPAPAPAPGPAITVPMNASEWETAWSIWNSYTAFRASKGVPQVVWSDYCALLAYNTCVAESRIGKMQHKIAIPADQQLTYSDILQYATWRKDGPEAVDRWSKSEGHHRMMRNNNGTTEAGVGVYYDGSRWWYTIVYNFVGRNQYAGPL